MFLPLKRKLSSSLFVHAGTYILLVFSIIFYLIILPRNIFASDLIFHFLLTLAVDPEFKECSMHFRFRYLLVDIALLEISSLFAPI